MDDPIILTILSVIILLVTTAFIAVFATEPWWRTQFGQSVMILAAAVWTFSVVALLRQLFGPDYPGRAWIIGFSRAAVIVAMSQRLYVLLLLRRRDRR